MGNKKKDSKLTPLMEQYLKIKDQYRDMILLYRMGDFYETFFDDAKTISRVLGIALTKRSHGKGGDAPLAGFPYHALDNYLPKLVQAGYKVAICEQVEDPKKAKVVVKREVVEVITPGTTVSEKILENKLNNYLASVYLDEKNKKVGIAFVDVSTGEFSTTESDLEKAYEIILSFGPREILISKSQDDLIRDLLNGIEVIFTTEEDWIFSYQYAYDLLLDQFSVRNLKGFGLEHDDVAVSAAGAILYYLQENFKQKLSHIQTISRLHFSEYMILDEATRRNLELTVSLSGMGKKGTLIDIVDFTQTPMGGRLLKQWLNRPLIRKDLIEERQKKVSYYYEHEDITQEIREILSEIYDLERMGSRLATGRLNPRDLLFLKRSLESVEQLEELFNDHQIPDDIRPVFDNCHDIIELIESSIDENAPVNIKDGNIIKAGYNQELDELKTLASQGKQWLVEFQARERERTGIPSLKVGYNKVFGYYIEVTKTHQDKVPEYYVKKQTLVNADRYITDELKEYEDKILGAEEKIAELEYRLFQQIREQIASRLVHIINNARNIAELDVLTNFAFVAHKYKYVKPQFVEEPILYIKDGRHPVVEHFLPPGESFVNNDTNMSNDDCQIMIITGPNMAGKSTYLRQVGLLVLLAQVGSFVPASEMKLGVIDRIFTRVGASDNIASGESTFMVEMLETANILNNATPNSLILLDEIGRGTSTFDGLSIAWAVTEYIHNTPQIAAKTLFATHYHELTELEMLYPRIKNFNVAVKEVGDHVIFLRKIVPGGTDNSYGIHVASMAGLPQPVIERAREILENLESEELTPNKEPKLARRRTGRQVDRNQLTIFDFLKESPVEKEIKNIDINNLTPLEALNKLNELKKLIK